MKLHHSRVALFFGVLLFPCRILAQDLAPGVSPAALVRLTGVLEVVGEPRSLRYPVLRVWLDDTFRVFRVSHAEAIVPAYPVEEQLRNVSSLGIRLLAGGEIRTMLLSSTMYDRSIVIEGWLRPRAGVFKVRAVEVVAGNKK
jgi:hypothetical protein